MEFECCHSHLIHVSDEEPEHHSCRDRGVDVVTVGFDRRQIHSSWISLERPLDVPHERNLLWIVEA